MEFDFPLQESGLSSELQSQLQLDSLQSTDTPFALHPIESGLPMRSEKEDVQRSNKVLELMESLQKEKRRLELNQLFQTQLYERLRVIDMLLDRDSAKSQNEPVSAPLQDALSIQETPEADLADRREKSRQLLLSFPPPGSALYFTRKRHYYPRFLSSEGKPLTHSTVTSVAQSQRWSEAHNKRLNELVLSQCSSLLHVQSSSMRSTAWVKAYRSAKTDEERRAALQQLIPSLLNQFSWEQIAHDMDHSTTDCFVHWLNCCDSYINNAEWSLDEDVRLLALAKENGGRHWVRVALQLGNGRTPYQCFERFVRAMDMKDYNQKWTEEEDEKVIEGVSKYGTKSWKQVALMVPKRTWMQCRSRYYQALQQVGRKGRWSQLENCRLLLILLFFGMDNWSTVSKRMMSRNSSQCRDRWVNVLCPSNRKTPWSRKEDQLLLKLCEQSTPIVWKTLCKHFPGRTPDACKSRYNVLKKQVWCVCLIRMRILGEKTKPKRNTPGSARARGGSLGSRYRVGVLFSSSSGHIRNHCIISTEVGMCFICL